MKTTFKEYLNEENSEVKYYTTSYPMTIKDFIDIEVEERGNYELKDVQEWVEDYSVTPNTKLLWVATKPYVAARYQMNADDWDNAETIYNENPNDFDVQVIDGSEGTIIEETDDGDDGYLFIFL